MKISRDYVRTTLTSLYFSTPKRTYQKIFTKKKKTRAIVLNFSRPSLINVLGTTSVWKAKIVRLVFSAIPGCFIFPQIIFDLFFRVNRNIAKVWRENSSYKRNNHVVYSLHTYMWTVRIYRFRFIRLECWKIQRRLCQQWLRCNYKNELHLQTLEIILQFRSTRWQSTPHLPYKVNNKKPHSWPLLTDRFVLFSIPRILCHSSTHDANKFFDCFALNYTQITKW